MKKKEYVVRVVQTDDDVELLMNKDLSQFVECLRYAGLVTVHEVDPRGLTTLCFDIRCPHGLNSKAWSEQNAARMKSFGYNAVSAPSTL
jgi:hypothetical protein